MLKVRVIPTMLLKGPTLAKGVAFDSWRRVGTAMPALKVYNARDVDELVLVDIAATRERCDPDYGAIEQLAAECFVPFTVGGGIDSLEKIRRLLRVGADKVVLNSALYRQPMLVSEAAQRFGSQCIVASIDFRRVTGCGYECYSESGTRPTGWDIVAWAREVEKLGAGEILLTAIDRDGTMQGYDVEAIRAVANAVTIPVIAAGGAGSYEHMYDAIALGAASAVAAGAIFHFTHLTPPEARRYLAARGVAVRNVNVRPTLLSVAAGGSDE